ncbi:MAG TPA: hypothetical protein VMD48_10815 [Solirubrobacteraceae bacterium]|nr:hypothetical protein [Solirubrobacteraceae bacterium]
MNTETRLREALHERAHEVPDTAIARVAAHEYHPRMRPRPPIAIGAAGIAGTAGAVAAIISLTAGASTAFAGWKAKPTPASARQIAAASADCSAHLPVAGIPLVLTDSRGPFTFQIYADSNASTICTTGPSFQSVSTNRSSQSLTPASDGITATISQSTNENGQAYSFAEGRVGSAVSGVALVRSDGGTVTATVQNGWYVAWWPGAATVGTAQITTPSGVHSVTLSRYLLPGAPSGASMSSGFSSSGSSASSGGTGHGESTQSFGSSSSR